MMTGCANVTYTSSFGRLVFTTQTTVDQLQVVPLLRDREVFCYNATRMQFVDETSKHSYETLLVYSLPFRTLTTHQRAFSRQM